MNEISLYKITIINETLKFVYKYGLFKSTQFINLMFASTI